MKAVKDILEKSELSKEDIISLLSVTNKADHEQLIRKAYSVKVSTIGKKDYLRGLIEFSNQCKKNCLYCGIRAGNTKVKRYSMPDKEILDTVKFAQQN